jgi:hypothetical protein
MPYPNPLHLISEMRRTKEEQAAFDRALDEAFTAIVVGKLEDIKTKIDRFREQVEARRRGENRAN